MTRPDQYVPLQNLRVVKAAIVLQIGVFALLVGWNNIVDYGSNFSFVQHVLTMDTTFEGNRLTGRALHAPLWHHAAYALIILCELGTGLLCLCGAWRVFRQRGGSLQEFHRALMPASRGLLLGFTLWFGGFMIIGAEWFLMWQSPVWNGQEGAFRFLVCILLTLVFIHLPEPTYPSGAEPALPSQQPVARSQP